MIQTQCRCVQLTLEGIKTKLFKGKHCEELGWGTEIITRCGFDWCAALDFVY